MKILYVGDNRTRGNYGCRATSTALSLLIGKNHTIVGRVYGDVTHTYPNIFYCKCLPNFFYRFISKLKYWNKLQPIMARICFKLGKILKRQDWFDFISYDMEKSITNLKRCLPANPNLNQLNIEEYDYDCLVVNGEGSFVFCTPQWREPLVISMCMYWALKNNKKVYFMNAMFSDKPHNERNLKTIKLVESLLQKCVVVAARELVSFDYVKNNLSTVKPQLIPDALFTWYDIVNDNHKVENGKYYLAHAAEEDDAYYNLDFTKPYILISGSSSSLLEDNPQMAIKTYIKIANRLKEVYNGNVFFIQVCEGDYFLHDVAKITKCPIISIETPLIAAAKILAGADVYVSGRYHPAIMASLGGTPCVFMGSNSHKTLSLQQLLNYNNIIEFPVLPNDGEIIKMIDMAMAYVANNLIIRKRIKEKSFELAKQAYVVKDLIK